MFFIFTSLDDEDILFEKIIVELMFLVKDMIEKMLDI
jgi:hypothetical protein